MTKFVVSLTVAIAIMTVVVKVVSAFGNIVNALPF